MKEGKSIVVKLRKESGEKLMEIQRILKRKTGFFVPKSQIINTIFEEYLKDLVEESEGKS